MPATWVNIVQNVPVLRDFLTVFGLGTPIVIDDTTNTAYYVKSPGDVVTAIGGGGSGSLADGDYGDVTVSGTGTVITVDPAAITLAKMANVATGTVFYRTTAGTGAPEVQTLATLKTALSLTGTNSGDQTTIVGITGTTAQFNTALTDGDFATGGGTATGTNTGDQTTITGNAGTATALQTSRNFSIGGSGITAAAVGFTGTGNVVLAASVDAGHITRARMADMGAVSRLVGSGSAGVAATEITLGSGLTMTGTTLSASGGGGGGGSFTLTEIEVNLGSKAAYSGSFTIAGAGLTVGKPVLVQQAVGPYTGKGDRADEAEMDQVTATGSVTSTTEITCYWHSSQPVIGNFKFNYVIGA